MKHYDENSARHKFRTAKIPYGENSVQRKIHTAKILYGKKSYGKNRMAKFPTEEIPATKFKKIFDFLLKRIMLDEVTMEILICLKI